MLLLNLWFSNNGWSAYNYIWQGFGIGMMNHLFCDMMTRGGIPLLYPFYRWKFSFTNLKSGSRWEIFTLVGVCILTAILTILFIAGGTYL
jgi:membrane-bound metal-dependent hydrolase YbcI (DUF457 family)